MKRIALLILCGISFLACNNPLDPEPDPDPCVDCPPGKGKEISLKVHVPPKSITTYANEDASPNENMVDSIFVNLYQGAGASRTLIHQGKFGLANFDSQVDSIIKISYEVDNISATPLEVEVFANRRQPAKITSGEVPLPNLSQRSTFFYMSGQATLTNTGTAYAGDVHIVRNVAKLRINVSKNSVVIPSDLSIDYNNIKIKVINATDSTTAFGGVNIDALGIGYFDYLERSGINLRRHLTKFSSLNGGQIDSLYLYENRRSNYSSPTDRRTFVQVTIPTQSSEGNKDATYTYPLFTTTTGNAILRNYIYTLDIKVRGQELTPLITLEILPWNDVHVNGDILGTYLTLDKTDLRFVEVAGTNYAEAVINYCSDAQAIYFDFSEFNALNPLYKLGQAIEAIGIDTARTNQGGFPLAPDGFTDAQILLDKQHCGQFKFRLDLAKVPQWPNVTFSGRICLKAGNIVQCLTFPARLIYDAHFIVGEPLFNGEQFISAYSDIFGPNPWLEVSPQRLWTTAANASYSGSAAPLFLHLDENLGTYERTTTLTLVNGSGNIKKIDVTQLPVIPLGRFGYIDPFATDDNVYNAQLFTEQMYEFTTMPIWGASGVLPNNALYNGRFPTVHPSVFDATNYQQLNYHASNYAALNYCAYKNRPATKTSTGVITNMNDVKWYLPAQAQLMAMYTSYESYRYSVKYPYSNFFRNGQPADNYWSATANDGYSSQAQYLNFRYGNVGHYERNTKYWARCVRNGIYRPTMIAVGTNNSTFEFPTIRFDQEQGFPVDAISLIGKSSGLPPNTSNIQGDENSIVNMQLYMRLRVAKSDLNSNAMVPWALNLCSTYNETDIGSPYPALAVGEWRLPTQRELQAIWILQNEIKNLCPSFNLLSDNYYWSATDVSTAPTTSAWTVFGSGSTTLKGGAGNAPHQLKVTPLRVRCVAQYSL